MAVPKFVALPDERLGSLIRRRRRELGLTSLQIATAVGVSKGTVAKWETGETVPVNSATRSSLSTVLNVNRNTLRAAWRASLRAKHGLPTPLSLVAKMPSFHGRRCAACGKATGRRAEFAYCLADEALSTCARPSDLQKASSCERRTAKFEASYPHEQLGAASMYSAWWRCCHYSLDWRRTRCPRCTKERLRNDNLRTLVRS